MNAQPTFNISDHLEKLEPVKGQKDRYICPVCGGNNLTIGKDGAYKCWSGDCSSRSIRDTIAPLPDKEAEPAGQKVYTYADRQGKEIIRVIRKDDGNGSKRIYQEYYWRGSWRSSGIPDDEKKKLKAAVLPYRYSEAIKHDSFFCVEGEKCVDALWNIGIPAITTIGGCDGLKNYGDYSGLFDDRELILCPDMDAPGVKYAEGLAALYPSTRWLYAFPSDPRWRKLPGKGGLDIADWIAQGTTKEDILAAIEPTRRASADTSAKVTPIRPDIKTALDLEQTTERIKNLLSQDLSPAAMQAAKIELRSQTVIQEREFNDLWKALEAERELAESRDDRKGELDKLLKISQYDLTLKGILHDAVADPLERIAGWLGATPSAMLLTLLPTVATLCCGGTELELIKATGFNALPILYTGICAESGSAKSPVQKTILKPLFKLQAEAEQRYQEDLEAWEVECKEAKQNDDPPPSKPAVREYYTVDVTREAIAMIQSQQPDRGFLGWMDELSAVIGGQNQYRNGRGTDREALLTGRDGTGLKVNRAGGKRISVPVSLYSITGGTQPDTLKRLMGDFSDGSGQWARFLWCLMPVKSAQYPDGADSSIFETVQSLLYRTYETIEGFPAQKYVLEGKAQSIYRNWFNQLDNLRIAEMRQALRSCYAKAKINTGEIALLLHIFNAAIVGQRPAAEISAATLKAAINVMKFCLSQVKLIHSMGDEGQGELSPILAKIIELANRKGSISARDAKNGISALKVNKTMTTAAVRHLFNELVEMGHGVIEGTGDRAKLRTVDTVDKTVDGVSTVRNLEESKVSAIEGSESVDNCRYDYLHPQTFELQEIQAKCRYVDSDHTFSSPDFDATLLAETSSVDEYLQFDAEGAESFAQNAIEGVDTTIYSSSTVQDNSIAAKPDSVSRSTTVDRSIYSSSTVSTVPASSLNAGQWVNKRYKDGWAGQITSIHADGINCDVLWAGDKIPTAERITDLKRDWRKHE